jgi:2-C-methyl-D-erythritol 4-phosphate cytidylyltransferase/2-C-methyl-D-erythritol 2,4-cyclodiphosphate synthase
MTHVTGILLCAGTSSRMGFDKLLTPIAGKTAIERSLSALILGGIDAVVFAVSPASRAYAEALACPVPKSVVFGGKTRAESVKNALNSITETEIVAIHDAARCMVSPQAVRSSIESARRFGSGVLAAKASDTIMLLDGETPVPLERDKLVRMQTPQTFRFSEIKRAYEGGLSGATDDCSLYIAAGFTPRFVFAGDENTNRKLTSAEDWRIALAAHAHFGTGFDTHRLAGGRPLVLGGVKIPFEKGLLGHSDADVLVHALADALLGAASLGDIGRLYPDSDPAYQNIDSMLLLKDAVRRVQQAGFRVGHADATMIAERPKLAPYVEQMTRNLAAALCVPPDAVSVKATTTEGMNDEGKGLCISASAIISIV